MRKSLWIMLAVMVVAVGAPNAHADTVTLDLSGSALPFGGASCAPSPCLLGGDIVINNTTGTVISVDFTVAGASPSVGPFNHFDSFHNGNLSISDMPGNFFSMDLSGTGTLVGYTGGLIDFGFITIPGGSGFNLNFPAALTETTPAPEPSSVALMLLGVGLVFVMRKRNSRGHQLAT